MSEKCPYIVSTTEGTNYCRLNGTNINNQEVNVVFLAYSLACKQLAQDSDKDARWWSKNLGLMAQSLISSNSVTLEQLKELLETIYPDD